MAAEIASGDPREIALVGHPEAADTVALLDVIHEDFRPGQVLALKIPGADSLLPLLQDRNQIEGQATAYVCRRFLCRLPVTEEDQLRKQLESDRFLSKT